MIQDISKLFADDTFAIKEPLWMDNLAQNMCAIRSGKDLKELSQIGKGKPAIIVGAGPSITKYNHLKMLKDADFQGLIIATDRMLIPLLHEGLHPNYVVTTDGDPIIANYYDDPIIMNYTFVPPLDRYGSIKAIFNALTVHPKTVEKWKGDIYWFISPVDNPLDEKNPKSLTKAIWLMTRKMILESLGNVGGTSWNLACFFGCEPIALIGMDFSYEDDTPLEKTIYYDAWMKLCNGDAKKAAMFYRRDIDPFFGKYALSDRMWDSYASVLSMLAQRANRLTMNCSGQGILHGPLFKGFESMHFKDFLAKYGR